MNKLCSAGHDNNDDLKFSSHVERLLCFSHTLYVRIRVRLDVHFCQLSAVGKVRDY